MPRLRGLGHEITLGSRAVVGRDPDCDVVLDDASVSRRHAVLVSDGKGRCRVKDLASANGTFADGIRVGRNGVAVRASARLRFGEVEVQLLEDGTLALRRRLVATGAAAIVLLCAAVLLRGRSSAAPRPSASAAPAMALVEEAAAALEAGHADEAEALAQKAVAADPLQGAARAALARSRREREAARVHAQAMAAADTAPGNEALHLLARVPQDSRLFARARIRAKEIAGAALRAHGAACRAASDAERWAEAAAECGSALEISCQIPAATPDPLLAPLREAERKSGRKVPWSCPADLAPLLRDEAAETPAQPPEALLAERYGDPKIRAAVSLYVHGEPSEAVRALSRLGPLARAVADRIRKAEGRSREGRTALLAGDLLRFDRAHAEALRIDAEIVPEGVDSVPRRHIQEALARAHGRLGDDYFAKGQYASAFDEWQEALLATPRDPHLLDSLARLDEVARSITEDGKASCADLGIAAHVASRGGPADEAARRALSRCR